MPVTSEELQSGLAALNGAEGVSDESKQAMAQALASDFAEDVATDDPAVDGAIDDAGMSEAYTAASDDEKKELRARFARLLTKQKSKAIATFKAAPAKTEGKDAPLTLASAKTMFGELLTKALPGQGRVADAKANPVAGVSTDKTGFSAKMSEIEKKEGVKRPVALLKARKEDPKGYNAWVAAGRPE